MCTVKEVDYNRECANSPEEIHVVNQVESLSFPKFGVFISVQMCLAQHMTTWVVLLLFSKSSRLYETYCFNQDVVALGVERILNEF